MGAGSAACEASVPAASRHKAGAISSCCSPPGTPAAGAPRAAVPPHGLPARRCCARRSPVCAAPGCRCSRLRRRAADKCTGWSRQAAACTGWVADNQLPLSACATGVSTAAGKGPAAAARTWRSRLEAERVGASGTRGHVHLLWPSKALAAELRHHRHGAAGEQQQVVSHLHGNQQTSHSGELRWS